MRPHTPTINTSRTGVNVTSPPETPTTGSPTFNRRSGAGANGRKETRGVPPRSSSPPLGGVGSQFTQFNRFNPFLGLKPEEISPRSSPSSDDETSEDESEQSASPPLSPRTAAPGIQVRGSYVQATTTRIIVEAAFEVEECSSSDEDEDAMDSGGSDDSDDEDVLRPDSIESPKSDRSRLTSRSDEEVSRELVDSLQDLHTAFSSSEEEDDSDIDEDYAEYLRELRRARQQRRSRRMSSMSKRTVSERGSDEDREDLQPWDTGDTNQRRLRRKVHNRNRHSLLSVPPEIIIELKEPNSDGEVVWDEHEINLARELPFWTMEVDSE